MNRARTSLRVLAAIVGALALHATAAHAEFRTEKTLSLAPGGKFFLSTDAGSVRISGSPDSGARVVITSRDDDLEKYFRFDFQEKPGEVRVTARQTTRTYLHNVSLEFEVQVPRATTASIKTAGGSLRASALEGDLSLDTSGGSITVEDLAGKLAAETSGGSISLRAIRGPAKVSTSGGHIEARDLTSSLAAGTSGGSIEVEKAGGDLELETSGGSIRVSGAAGKVDAETSAGSVEVEFVKGNSKGGTIESSAGGVRVAVDPAADLSIEAETSVGGVRSDLPLTLQEVGDGSRLAGTLGRGGATLKIHTSAGSVRIEALK